MALIDNLIQALQVLPGVGPKSAQRMALAYCSETVAAVPSWVTSCCKPWKRYGVALFAKT